MRDKVEPVVTLILLIVAGGCEQRTASGSVDVTETDSAGVSLVRISGSVEDLPVLMLSAAPIAEVSGDAPPFLGSVGEVEILYDGGLLIEDNQTAELRRFDPSGLELQVLGRRGDGPGEFQNLTELTVTAGDTAYAYDRRLYGVSRFNPDGTLAATLSIGRERAGSGSLVLDAWALDSQHLFLHSLGARDNTLEGRAFRHQRDAVLHRLDGSGTDLGPSVSFTGGYSIAGDHGDAGSPFANSPFVSVAGDQVLYGSSLNYELVLTGIDLEPRRIIRWAGWAQPLTESTIQAVRDSIEAGLSELRAARPEMVTNLMNALFDPTLLPDTLPALHAAVLDDTGRIWVSAFRPGLSLSIDEGRAWHLLDSRGAPLARIQLPPTARLAAIRGERVALIERDALDVEHVRVYELQQSVEAR
jgi:hypothetical protein